MAPRLTVSVVNDSTGARTPLTTATDIQYERRDSGMGTGAFTIANTSAERSLVSTGTAVAFRLDGTETFTAVVVEYEQTTVDEGEEATEATRFTVESVLSELRHAIVYPPLPPGDNPFGDTVYFDFGHPLLDESDWVPAPPGRLFQCDVSRLFGTPNTPPFGLYGMPEAWPDPTGVWMAPIEDTELDGDPIGTWFARRWFTLDEDSELVIYAAADDAYDIRLDGMPILQHDDPNSRDVPLYSHTTDGWKQAKRVRVKVSAGNHVLAAAITNWTGMSVFLCAVYKIANTWLGSTQVKLFGSGIGGDFDPRGPGFSDYGWIVLPYPADAPGFTPTRVMEILLNAAKARGAIPKWFANWNTALAGARDTANTLVPKSPDFNFKVGDSLFDVLAKMGEGYIEFDADIASDGDRLLSVWVARDDPTYPGRNANHTGFQVVTADNATSVVHGRSIRDIGNQFLTLFEGGYFEHPPSGSPSDPEGYGRREAFLSLSDTKNLSMAVNTTAAHVQKFNKSEHSITAAYFPFDDGGADTPPQAFDLGDFVTSVNEAGGLEEFRVKAIAATEPTEGKLIVVPTLGTLQAELEERFDRWLTRTAPGMWKGRSEWTSPSVISKAEQESVPRRAFTWEQSGEAQLDVGVPWEGLKPVKVVKIKAHIDDIGDGSGTRTRIIINRAPNGTSPYLLVHEMIIEGNKHDHIDCVELYGTHQTHWNAEIVEAGSLHKRISVECEWIDIG